MKDWLQKYGATAFVIVGLVVVGVTVTQVQTQQRIPTKAAGDQANQANELGIWFEPGVVRVDADGQGVLRVRLETLDQPITHGRLVMRFLTDQLIIEKIMAAGAFEQVDSQIGEGEMIMASDGEIFGSGTWAQIYLQLPVGVDQATLTVDPELSSLRYVSGSRQIGKKQIIITR